MPKRLGFACFQDFRVHITYKIVQKTAFICLNICLEQEIFIPLHRKIKQNILFINLKIENYV